MIKSFLAFPDMSGKLAFPDMSGKLPHKMEDKQQTMEENNTEVVFKVP